MTDPITDMLNRIRNAHLVRKEVVEIPFSSIKFKIAAILKKQGFVLDYKKMGKATGKLIKIDLRYTEEKEPAISGFKRISKPGQKIYKRAKEIRKVKGGSGMAIVSTSKGVLTGGEARKQKIGGEILCEIW